MNKRLSEDILFGEWVRQRRHMLDLTQQELADQVGCARITLRRIEAGTLKPSRALAQILLEKLGKPLSQEEEWLQFARGLSGLPGSSVASFEGQPLTNLPTSLTSFIGRGKEQDEVIQLIEKNRLVTIAGVGGIGKTRLALQIGQKLLNDFPNGVWFISLESLSDPTLITSTVSAVFDIREGSSDQPLSERLIYYLQAKTTLLILDNCEHLLDACAQLITTLLANCQNLKVLATSREILNMEGEATYYASTLSLPEVNERSIQKILDYESIQLFAERATLALSSFRLTADSMQPTLNICRRVDGIPLAIEMAAARVGILTVDEILRQLDHCFDLLVGKSRSAVPRHQTMRACMDWSWGLLTGPEQKFMRQLSIFAGGWTLESAKAVCKGDVVNLISALMKKSLMIVNQELGHETRYRFHEMARQYAGEKLVESGEEEGFRARHLKYFLELSKLAEHALRGPAQRKWHTLLNDERDNIRAASEWADKIDVEAGLYISGSLQSFWESLDLSEGGRLLAKFLDRSESKSYPHARAKALCTQAMLFYWAQEFNLAHPAAQESLDLYRACGDKFGEIDSLLMLAISDYNTWDSESLKLYQQALDLSKFVGDEWRQAQALFQLGSFGSDYNRRISYMQEAVALFKKVGDLELTTEHLISLGELELVNGNPQSARNWLNEAINVSQNSNKTEQKSEANDLHGIMTLSRQLKNKSWLAYVLQIYGRIVFACGDFGEAYASLHKSIEIGQEIDHRMVYLWSRTHLGYLTLHQGNITEARQIFADTVHNFQKDENTIGVVFVLEGMADLYVAIGKSEQAARLIGWADATRKQIDDPRPLFEQRDVDKIIAACLAKLGEVTFSDAYEEGQKITLDDVVLYALNES